MARKRKRASNNNNGEASQADGASDEADRLVRIATWEEQVRLEEHSLQVMVHRKSSIDNELETALYVNTFFFCEIGHSKKLDGMSVPADAISIVRRVVSFTHDSDSNFLLNPPCYTQITPQAIIGTKASRERTP